MAAENKTKTLKSVDEPEIGEVMAATNDNSGDKERKKETVGAAEFKMPVNPSERKSEPEALEVEDPPPSTPDPPLSVSVSGDSTEASMPPPVSFSKPNSDAIQFKMPSIGPIKTSSKVKAAFADSSAGSVVSKKPTDNNDASDCRKETEKSKIAAPDAKVIPKVNNSSPAEKLKQATTPQQLLSVPYKEPAWGGTCDQKYSFEIVKGGSVLDNYDLTTKSFHVVGRLPACDYTMEHPSLSRHHAILQYCSVANERHPIGWYLYDLDSTHGTTVNKHQVKARVYTPLKVGYMIKFAGSSRLHILQGPDEDQEEESKLSVNELYAQREAEKEAAEKKEDGEEILDAKKEDEGCSWGMAEDAAEPDMENNPFTLTAEAKNENLYIDDPKKALKGFFEREGYELPEYEFVSSTGGKHTCRVELPVDLVSGPTGEPLYGEASIQGKKKDCVIQCALDACRILDKHDLLRKSTHESRASKKKKNWQDDDYYGSDDDEFLDRTGDIEKKRKLRMKMFGSKNDKVETYETLVKKLEDVESEIAELEDKLEKAKSDKQSFEDQGMDALDAYMSAIKSGTMDTKTRTVIKRSLVDLRREQQRLNSLVNVARPAQLPALKKEPPSAPKPKGTLPMFGKMKGKGTSNRSLPAQVPHEEDVAKWKAAELQEEEEDSEEEQEEKEVSKTETKMKPEDKDEKNISSETEPNKAVSMRIQPKMYEEIEKKPLEKNLKGPLIHPVLLENKKEEKEEDSPPPPKKPKVAKPSPLTSKEYCEDDPDYAVWVPPQGQTGDGKTHLNAKYGY